MRSREAPTWLVNVIFTLNEDEGEKSKATEAAVVCTTRLEMAESLTQAENLAVILKTVRSRLHPSAQTGATNRKPQVKTEHRKYDLEVTTAG